ncbi:MAG TPA: quinol oxidase [Aromatoleum sp.]|uniref:quinol oxidase n=1 Tax=Aromatoleum sp. TaxID=2307007 RepID=UPI002B471D97|nr:quinol oxidase [Aromatoleum sp.]HJV24197.1 quinol oxidase [Aromatoleum sp.]
MTHASSESECGSKAHRGARTMRGALSSCSLIAMLFASGSAASADDAPPQQATADADGVQRVAIVGGSYFFKPDKVVAKAGQPLEISVRMEQGIVPHRFVLDGPNGKPAAEVELSAAPRTVRVELPPGEYQFYCPNRLLMFKSHRERGMTGTLQVRE